MSKIDCQKNLTGYDIARVRPDLETADRPKTRGSMGICNLSYGQNQRAAVTKESERQFIGVEAE